jgi:hypothetical protein
MVRWLKVSLLRQSTANGTSQLRTMSPIMGTAYTAGTAYSDGALIPRLPRPLVLSKIKKILEMINGGRGGSTLKIRFEANCNAQKETSIELPLAGIKIDA